jgi:hypothetical protein
MLTSSELKFYNDLDLKSLVNRISIPGRVEEERMLYNFSYHDEDRNLMMFPAMINEPGFAKKSNMYGTVFCLIYLNMR